MVFVLLVILVMHLVACVILYMCVCVHIYMRACVCTRLVYSCVCLCVLCVLCMCGRLPMLQRLFNVCLLYGIITLVLQNNNIICLLCHIPYYTQNNRAKIRVIRHNVIVLVSFHKNYFSSNCY